MLCYFAIVFNANRIEPNHIQSKKKLTIFEIYTFLYIIIINYPQPSYN